MNVNAWHLIRRYVSVISNYAQENVPAFYYAMCGYVLSKRSAYVENFFDSSGGWLSELFVISLAFAIGMGIHLFLIISGLGEAFGALISRISNNSMFLLVKNINFLFGREVSRSVAGEIFIEALARKMVVKRRIISLSAEFGDHFYKRCNRATVVLIAAIFLAEVISARMGIQFGSIVYLAGFFIVIFQFCRIFVRSRISLGFFGANADEALMLIVYSLNSGGPSDGAPRKKKFSAIYESEVGAVSEENVGKEKPFGVQV